MKRLPILLILVLAAGCSEPKEQNPAVMEFIETLRAFPDAGYMPWENGVSMGIPIKSENEDKIFQTILDSFADYRVIGPLTKIEKKESDLHEPMYGIQLEKKTEGGKHSSKSILLVFRIGDDKETFWCYRSYSEERINQIQEMVAEGLVNRQINNQNESNQSQ